MNYFRMRDTGQVVTEQEYRLASNKTYPEVFTPEDADPILESPAPKINEHQRYVRNGVKQINGLWFWDWDIINFTDAEILIYEDIKAKNNAAIIASKIDKLWAAANKYVENYISGTAVVFLVLGVSQGKPKAKAIQTWINNIWAEYYNRKAQVSLSSELNTDYAMFGAMPYSVPELQAETYVNL